jgi:hypothetical protein
MDDLMDLIRQNDFVCKTVKEKLQGLFKSNSINDQSEPDKDASPANLIFNVFDDEDSRLGEAGSRTPTKAQPTQASVLHTERKFNSVLCSLPAIYWDSLELASTVAADETGVGRILGQDSIDSKTIEQLEGLCYAIFQCDLQEWALRSRIGVSSAAVGQDCGIEGEGGEGEGPKKRGKRRKVVLDTKSSEATHPVSVHDIAKALSFHSLQAQQQEITEILEEVTLDKLRMLGSGKLSTLFQASSFFRAESMPVKQALVNDAN